MFFKSREANLVVKDLNDETLIYDFSRNKAYCLNETAAFIWNSLDGKQSVSQIAEALAKKRKQPINEEIIWLALDDLKREGLMTEFEATNSPIRGISRREVVKRVGLATMITLPVISFITAPKAAQAASTLGGCGAPCANGCQTGGCNTGDGGSGGGYCYDTSFRSIPSGATYCTNQNIDCSDAANKCCSGGPAAVVSYNCPIVPGWTQCRCS